MSLPLLQTKLYAPKRRAGSPDVRFVNRPRLLEKLDAGLAGKLTLISAPAGFGKTTLVSEWIEWAGEEGGRGRQGDKEIRRQGDREKEEPCGLLPGFRWMGVIMTRSVFSVT